MGYPVLTYTINGNQITVRQTRFLSDPNKKSNAKETPSPYGFVHIVMYLFSENSVVKNNID
jgi:hypothetical protein